MADVSGRVIRKQVAAGSKSERNAVCLDTGAKYFILRRQRGNPFHDEELEKLVGKQVRAVGSEIGGGAFLASAIEVVPA